MILVDSYTVGAARDLQDQRFALARGDALVVHDRPIRTAWCRSRSLSVPSGDRQLAMRGATDVCDNVPQHLARVVSRELLGSGMHTTLKTTLALYSRQRVLACHNFSLALVELLPHQVYVDEYEISQLEVGTAKITNNKNKNNKTKTKNDSSSN